MPERDVTEMASDQSPVNSLRVANIIEDGRLAGPQIRIANVAAALRGVVETTVVTSSRNSSPFQALCNALAIKYELLPLTRITKKDRVEALRYVLYWPIEVFLLVRYFLRERFDLVHVSGGSWQFKGVVAGKLARRKVIWHLNDTRMPGFIRLAFRLLSPLCDGFIYASERSYAYYSALAPRAVPFAVVPAPVDTSRFDPDHAYDDDDALIRWLGDDVVVGTIANISPIKDIALLIRAAGILEVRPCKLVFLVIGPVFEPQRAYYNDLRKLRDELGVKNVRFIGSRSDVRPLLARIDIYACSSSAESSPISVWEALSMGKPVVSTDVGDVPFYVRDGENGYIVPVGDAERFAARISALGEDKRLREQFGQLSRQIAVERLDLGICAESHLAFYKSMQ